MSPPSATEVEQLYRFARVFAENEEQAGALTARALDEILPEKWEIAHERLLQLFATVWEEAQKATGRAAGLPPFLLGLTPVRRAGCVLHYLLDLPAGEMERLTGLRPAELADSLRGCPPEDEARAALQALPLEPARLAALAAQAEAAAAESGIAGFRLWSPVGVALVISTLVLVAVLGWTFAGHHAYEDLPAGRKFFQLSRSLDGGNWEPVDIPAGDLTDWFFVKHHLENMQVPEALADLPAAGCTVQRVDGHPVAVIGLKDGRPLLLLFTASDFELEERPADDWSVFSEGELAGALQVRNGEACLVVLRGTEKEMQAFLAAPR